MLAGFVPVSHYARRRWKGFCLPQLRSGVGSGVAEPVRVPCMRSALLRASDGDWTVAQGTRSAHLGMQGCNLLKGLNMLC